MKNLPGLLLIPLVLLTGCPESEPKKDEALQAIEEHTTRMRKILLDNLDNCDRAVELYGKYVDQHEKTLKSLKARVKKIMDADKQGRHSDWFQEQSAKSTRDLSLFYRSCSGKIYASKLNMIDRRY